MQIRPHRPSTVDDLNRIQQVMDGKRRKSKQSPEHLVMFERPPNGFFVRDLILFNHLRRSGCDRQGDLFEAPGLPTAPSPFGRFPQDSLS